MASEKDQPDKDKTDQADQGRPNAIDDGASPEPAETMEATAAQSVNGEDAASQPAEPASEEMQEVEQAEPAVQVDEDQEVEDQKVEEAAAEATEDEVQPDDLSAAGQAGDKPEESSPEAIIDTAEEAKLEEANPEKAKPEEVKPDEVKSGEVEPDSRTGAQSGAFEILPVPGNDEEFNLKPKDRPEPIPEEQSEIANGIYETWGVLKLLREQRVFSSKSDQQVFEEFRERLIEVAEVGLKANHVKTRTAAKALEQIRQGVILRKGVAIKLTYLLQLAIWSLYGIFAGLILVFFAGTGNIPATLAGYGWVLIGAMVGAWMSVASTRSTLAFHEIAEYLSSTREPIVRLLFVGFLAMTLALLITYGVITLDMGKASLADFHDKRGVAVLIGLIAGIGEKAVSLRIIERVQKTVTTGTS